MILFETAKFKVLCLVLILVHLYKKLSEPK